MGKKYIIYLDTNERACITYISTDGVPSVAMVQATPYEESEAYKRGYDDAKHECQDCQKIMTDAEQERVDKAYQQGVNDAENRKATCEFCGYVNKGQLDEPCKFCANNYINRFVPRKDNKLIRKNIKDIMDSLDCTISDFEKAIEEMKNEAD
jgi:hypothetical protein